MYAILTVISIQDWGIKLKEATKEVNKLFVTDNEETGKKIIIDSLTQNKIYQAKQMVSNIYDIGDYELKKSLKYVIYILIFTKRKRN